MSERKQKIKRPTYLRFTVFDPFDDYQLFQFTEQYTRDNSARGEYRKSFHLCREMGKMVAQRLFQRGIRPSLRIRTPKVTVEYL